MWDIYAFGLPQAVGYPAIPATRPGDPTKKGQCNDSKSLNLQKYISKQYIYNLTLVNDLVSYLVDCIKQKTYET